MFKYGIGEDVNIILRAAKKTKEKNDEINNENIGEIKENHEKEAND